MKALLLCLSLALGACSFTQPRPATTWYMLEDQGSAQVAGQPLWLDTLLLRETDAPGFYQSDAMAYSRTAGTRSHYQYAHLTEPPGPRIDQLLRGRLEQSGLFTAVAALGSGVTGSYQLNPRLLDFYHDATQAPGEVKLLLEVELLRRGDAHRIALTRIAVHAPAPSFDARGAAQGANSALTQALDQITAWLTRVGAKLSASEWTEAR